MAADLESFDVASIATVEEGLEKIEENLLVLAALARETSFRDKTQRDRFLRNLVFMKQFYERVEALLDPGEKRC